VRRDPATCDPTVPMLRTPLHVMYRGLHARSRKQARERLRVAFFESFAALGTLARECRWSLGLWLRPGAKTEGTGERARGSEPRAALVMIVLGLASGVLLMKNLSRLELVTPHAAAETVVGHVLTASAAQPKAAQAQVISQLASMCMAGAEAAPAAGVARAVERREPVEKTSRQSAVARHEKSSAPHASAARQASSEASGAESARAVRRAALRHEAAQAERAERAMAHFAQKSRSQDTKHDSRSRSRHVGTH
jgi:hypothetical protein